MEELKDLEAVRRAIDDLDRDIVRMLALRADYVEQAGHFKKNRADVIVPERIEQIILLVRHRAVEHGMNPDLAERIYRAMIDCYILHEAQVWDKLHA